MSCHRAASLLVAVALALAAPNARADAGPDAGDAGLEGDAGDGGLDAGMDAGDAGEPDAGDAGEPDAGGEDGGIVQQDAGEEVDGAVIAPPVDAGRSVVIDEPEGFAIRPDDAEDGGCRMVGGGGGGALALLAGVVTALTMVRRLRERRR